ncbi:MAG: HDOD domain-containing protein [Gaiellaceae bacterium]
MPVIGRRECDVSLTSSRRWPITGSMNGYVLSAEGLWGEELEVRLVSSALSLPLGNQAALARVARLCAATSATPQGIALEAARDEGFAALLLRLANAAASMPVSRVADLPSAVRRLGTSLVQALAVAAPGLRLLQGPADGLTPARHELHRHAVRVGLAARLLAPATVDPEQALTAGLLHNIGLNVVSLYLPNEFRALLDAAARGEQLWPLEEEVLGFTHSALGARLAEGWSYPVELTMAIRDHDSGCPENELGAVVELADVLVRAYGVGVEAPRPLPALLPASTAGLERAEAQLQTLLEAQDRFDVRMDSETIEFPAPAPEVFSAALRQLR